MHMLSVVAEQADGFDVIHNHHDYWMLPLSRMTQTPLLTTLHGRMDLDDIQAAFLPYSEANYISISDSQRHPVSQFNWIKTIYHGLNIEAFKFYEKPGNYLAFLGRMSPEKKPDWAIQVAQAAGIPLKIAAKIEGPSGQSYYDRWVKPHVDGKWVEYVGEISEREKSEFLGNALALVFPIDWPEPFGLVVVESLACGTPVLARPCGAVPELLENGVTGFMHSKISGLARLAKSVSRINRRSCREWVEQKFSLQRMTEEYLHVYRLVAGKRHDSHRHRRNFLHPVKRPLEWDFKNQSEG
jgi:glycosyltransferase involved in cell wall biosynthesis